MTLWTIGWIVWAAFFLVFDIAALASKQEGATLSAHLWDWAAIKGKPVAWKARRIGCVIGLAWVVVHILTGGWV